MSLPPLVHYQTEAEYRDHYKSAYCRRKIQTHDKIPVFFQPQKFEHAFYESTGKYTGKNKFSPSRAQRIDWVKATLENSQATLYQGWHKDKKIYVPDRRVSFVYESFVVVIDLFLGNNQSLKGNFITCYTADQSIDKITSSPIWSMEGCIESLIKNGKIGR